MRAIESDQALRRALQKYDVVDYNETTAFNVLLDQADQVLIPVLTRIVRQDGPQKVQLTTKVRFRSDDDEEGTTRHSFPLNSHILPVTTPANVRSVLHACVMDILKQLGANNSAGTKGTYERTINIAMYLHKYQISSGGSYIPIPTEIAKRKAVINPKNDDLECFKWCILMTLFPVTKNKERVSNYKKAAEMCTNMFANLHYPVDFEQIKEFEQENNLAIYIFEPTRNPQDNDPLVMSRYKSTNKKNGTRIIDLLLITQEDTQGNVKCHYALINKLDTLFANITKNKNGKKFCRECDRAFHSQKAFDDHACIESYGQKYILINTYTYPAPGSTKKFESKKLKNKLPVPFKIFYDFECFNYINSLECIQYLFDENERPTTTVKQLTEHLPASFCIFVTGVDNIWRPPILRRIGQNSITNSRELMDEFYNVLDAENAKICDIIRKARYQPAEMIISNEEQDTFNILRETIEGTCHICEEPFIDPSLCLSDLDSTQKLNLAPPVRDHCHITGKYRGPAHQNCNTDFHFQTMPSEETYTKKICKWQASSTDWEKYTKAADRAKKAKKQNPEAKTKYVFSEKGTLKEVHKQYSIYKPIIPVLAHNARGYDSHLIIKHVNERYQQKNINCIPNNMEKYMMFEIGNLRFLDSMQFLMGSLDSHTENLIKAEKAASTPKLQNFYRYFSYLEQEAVELIKGKGTFPHDYHTDPDVYQETELPPLHTFDSYLYNKLADPKEYEEAQKVWDAIKCKNFGDYHDNYIVRDVLLLADIFQEFTRASLQDYKLDPAHSLASHGTRCY